MSPATPPPHDPRRAPQPYGQPYPPRDQPYTAPPGGRGPVHPAPPPDGGHYYGQDPYGQNAYGQDPRYDAPAPQRPAYREPAAAPRPPAARPQTRQAPQAPARQRYDDGPGMRLRIPGIGLIMTLVGTVVNLLSLTVLPWAMHAGANGQSLSALWTSIRESGANGFGDWYVILFSYPLVILGVLLAFAAVLESVAMKVVWAGLMLLGVGYLLLRYGVGPLTGSFGAQGFGTVEIVIALVAVAAVVLVVFALKAAVGMFRRVAGLGLIAMSGVHVYAVTDLAKAADIADVDFGAFGPTLGYLLIGVAALVGPRRLVPGL